MALGVVVAFGRHHLSADGTTDVLAVSELVRTADRFQQQWVVHAAFDVVAQRVLGAVPSEQRQNAGVECARRHFVTARCAFDAAATLVRQQVAIRSVLVRLKYSEAIYGEL